MSTTQRPGITIIGAGGFAVPFRLIGDLVSFPALRSAQLCLMDVDPGKLAPVADAARELLAHHGFDTGVVETTDRRAALDGPDFVVITFQVGGVEPCAQDPLEVCPDAVFTDCANPVAMAAAYLNAQGLRTVGLCRSEAELAAGPHEGGNERVRTTLVNAFGHVETGSTHHAPEHLPSSRENPEVIREHVPQRWDHSEICVGHDDRGDVDTRLERLETDLDPSVVPGVVPGVVHGTVPNATGPIANLPTGACVEIPCLVDENSVQPTATGELPLTAALLTVEQLRAMTDELLVAHTDRLPEARRP